MNAFAGQEIPCLEGDLHLGAGCHQRDPVTVSEHCPGQVQAHVGQDGQGLPGEAQRDGSLRLQRRLPGQDGLVGVGRADHGQPGDGP